MHFTVALALFWTLIVSTAAIPAAPPAPDTTHDEASGANGATPPASNITCPAGFTAGIGVSSGEFYCMNCGSGVQLGCNGTCTAQESCSTYADSVCLPFKTEDGKHSSNCIGGVDQDNTVFPDNAPGGGIGGSAPIECHAGGTWQELRAESFVTNGNKAVRGPNFSDMCGFALNNCATGMLDGATIYRMSVNPATGNNVTNGDFSPHSSEAIKFHKYANCH